MLTQKFPLRTITTLSQQRHTYATISNDSNHQHWPKPASSAHKHPTPYQILCTTPKEPYTKTRFIQLVKQYHPDHSSRTITPSSSASHGSSNSATLPAAIRLERYRLIVAAHALLSDPVKRAAYDTHGIGWLDGLEDSVIQKAAASAGRAGYTARYNATWEDWERWRFAQEDAAASSSQARDGSGNANGKPEPVYLRNGYFATLLIVLSIGAGAAQTMHAENLTEAKRLVREERHWVATQEYRKSQELARKLGREQRIEEFVRARDPAVLTQATLKEMVMNPDICESGTEQGRGKDLDMKRMFKK